MANRSLVQRSRMAFVGAVVCAVAWLAACVASTFDEGRYTCTPGPAASCPESLVCASDGFCRRRDVDGGPQPNEGGRDGEPPVDGGDPCPDAVWRVAFPDRVPEGVTVADDGRVYVAGAADKDFWVAELDRCTGDVVVEQTGRAKLQAETHLGAVRVTTTDVIVAGGSRDADGGATVYHARFDRGLTKVNVSSDEGAARAGDGKRLAVSDNGAFWIVGTKATPPGSGVLVRVGTTTCVASLATVPGSVAPRMIGGADVLRAGTTAAPAARVDFVDDQCGVTTTPKTLSIGTSVVTPLGLVAARGGLVGIGSVAGTGSNTSFWLAETTEVAPSWNIFVSDPNPFDPDIGERVAFDGEAVFAVVSQRASPGVGTPTLVRYEGPITAASKEVFSAQPFGTLLREVRDIAVAPQGRSEIYVAAKGVTGGDVARCTKSGTCMP